MADTALTIIAILALFVVLPAGILLARDRVRRRSEAPEAIAEARRSHEQRLRRPHWVSVSRQLQRPVPTALRELYADTALVTARDLRYSDEHSISTFEALDERAGSESSSVPGVCGVVFATTDTGDPIYLRAGPSEDDTVYVTFHDGGDTEVFAESVDGMLQRLRRPVRSE